MTFSDKSILVIGNGYEVEIVAAMGKVFKKAYYYTPWQHASPKFQSYAHGLGFEGIEKVLHPFDYIDKVDIIAFFDIGYGDMAAYLRNHGYTVFGAGKGEKLEERRFDFRQIQHRIGLPTQGTVNLKGTKALREFLKQNGDRYVKLDIFRGNIESFYSKNYDSVEMLLDEIDSAFGPMKEEYEFLVEESVESKIESGMDTHYSAPVGWIEPTLYGIEWSKNAYIGSFNQQLPDFHLNTKDKLGKVMKGLDYRGPISTEEKDIGGGLSVIIDITARLPFTFSAGYPDWILNYPEVVWKVARGEKVTIEPVDKFVGCIPLETTHLDDKWVKLDFDAKLRKEGVKNGRVRLAMASCVDGKYFAIPGMPVAYNLVAWGPDVDAVTDTLQGMLDKVDAFGLDKSSAGNLQKIIDLKKDMGWD